MTVPSLDELYLRAIRMHQRGQPTEAAALYDSVLARDPNHAGAIHLKGVLALQAGEYDRAIKLIERSLALGPRHSLALANLGVAYRSVGRIDDAVSVLREAVALDPKSAMAHGNLSHALNRSGDIAEAVIHARRSLAIDPGQLGLQSSALFAENYLAETDPVELADRARVVGAMFAGVGTARVRHDNDPDPTRSLRVGFVSADLRAHPVGRFLLGALGGLAEASSLELFAYANSRREDEVTTALQRMVPNWRTVAGTPDEALADQIVGDRIDVLFDLSGHSDGHRLAVFARRPAPVAVTWLGYFATTGLAAIDYVLANRWVIPEGEERQWVERVWRLPDSYLCFSRPADPPEVTTLPALAKGHITFASFNNFNKLSEATLRAWQPLLAAVPGARLILRSSGHYPPGIIERLHSRLAAAGFDLTRVRIDPRISEYAAHLASYGEVDVALDTFPYNGGTTTVEALYMGVPVLVRAGDRYVAHMGESILHDVGLSGWVAPRDADYAAFGARLVADLDALAALRAGLRARVLASPLFDARRFARNF
ncbi:MAG TPA: tetratricopeptide repeat protein, partial [Devosia sp.]|nr:tetratricopeptide repeat protein [Devosia sp.]